MTKRTVSSIISFLLLAVVVVGSVVVLLSQKHEFFGWQLMIVKSGSMEPAIKTGSVVLVQKQASYQEGEIVTYRSPVATELLITHRIAERVMNEGMAEPSFVLKGDANPAADITPIMASAIVGQAQLAIPWLGYGLAFLQTVPGVILFIVIPGTILIYEEIKSLHRHLQEHFVRKGALLMVAVLVGLVIRTPVTAASYVGATTLSSASFSTARWLNPSLNALQDGQTVLFSLNNIAGFDAFAYKITYTHVVDGNQVNEQIEGEIGKPLAQNSWDVPNFYIGTCSTDGCVPHENVTNMVVQVQLKKTGSVLQTLTQVVPWVN